MSSSVISFELGRLWISSQSRLHAATRSAVAGRLGTMIMSTSWFPNSAGAWILSQPSGATLIFLVMVFIASLTFYAVTPGHATPAYVFPDERFGQPRGVRFKVASQRFGEQLVEIAHPSFFHEGAGL